MPQFIATAGRQRVKLDELKARRKRLISEIAGIDNQRRSIRRQIADHHSAVSAKLKELDAGWISRAEHRSSQLLKEREALRVKLGGLNAEIAAVGSKSKCLNSGNSPGGLGEQFMAEAQRRLAPSVFASIYDAVCPVTTLGDGNHG